MFCISGWMQLLTCITDCVALIASNWRLVLNWSCFSTHPCVSSQGASIYRKSPKGFIFFISSPEPFNPKLFDKPTPNPSNYSPQVYTSKQCLPLGDSSPEQWSQLWSNYSLPRSYFNSLAASCQQGAVILFGCLQARSNSVVLWDSGERTLQWTQW